MVSTKELKEMDTLEVITFLEQHVGTPSTRTGVFKDNDIDGKVLLTMIEKELIKCGLLFGHARSIVLYLRELEKKEIEQELLLIIGKM